LKVTARRRTKYSQPPDAELAAGSAMPAFRCSMSAITFDHTTTEQRGVIWRCDQKFLNRARQLRLGQLSVSGDSLHFNIEQPTSNAEHQSYQPPVIGRSVFDVQRSMFLSRQRRKRAGRKAGLLRSQLAGVKRFSRAFAQGVGGEFFQLRVGMFGRDDAFPRRVIRLVLQEAGEIHHRARLVFGQRADEFD
jgi:hypothetical protein